MNLDPLTEIRADRLRCVACSQHELVDDLRAQLAALGVRPPADATRDEPCRPAAELPVVIGLAGYAGSGKSTLANLLAEHRGYRVAHLADGVREALRLLDPIVGATTGSRRPPRWGTTVVRRGYASAKRGPHAGEIRRLQQAMGTEIGREMFGEDVWVDLLDRTISPGERVVVADIRFENELAWIARAGGASFRITRAGVGPANNHASEHALDDAGLPVVINFGPPERMLARLEAACAAVAS